MVDAPALYKTVSDALSGKHFARLVHIDQWSDESQLLVFLAVKSFLLYVLAFFSLIPYFFNFIDLFLNIFVCGFIFTRVDQKFNVTLVLVFFLALSIVTSPFGRALLSIEDTADVMTDVGTGFIETLEDFNQMPTGWNNVDRYITGFMDIVNWILLMFMIGFVGSAVGDGLTFRWGSIPKKLATVALALVFYNLMLYVFSYVGVHPRTMADTAGATFRRLLRAIGLTMDAQGNEVALSAGGVVNWVVSYLPLFFPVLLLGLAVSFRHSSLRSLLFAREVRNESWVVEVKPTTFKLSFAALLLAFSIYVIGYMLVQTDGAGYDPVVGLTFFIVAAVVMVLLGTNVLVLNPKLTLSSFVTWTVFGFFALIMYFQFVQPWMLDVGWRDTSSDMTYLAQGSSLMNSDVLRQFFLVAAPETLIFQIGIAGLANRLWYYAFRGRAAAALREQAFEKGDEYERDWERVLQMAEEPGISQTRKLNLVLKGLQIERQYKKLNAPERPEKMGFAFFVTPTFIAGVLGSAVFSWYHSFRRGMTTAQWWQSNLGVTFWGAGFWLTFIAFFNMFAAIAVHTLNNWMVLFLAA